MKKRKPIKFKAWLELKDDAPRLSLFNSEYTLCAYRNDSGEQMQIRVEVREVRRKKVKR